MCFIFQRNWISTTIFHYLSVLHHPFAPLFVGNQHSHCNIHVTVGCRVAVGTVSGVKRLIFPCSKIRTGKVIGVQTSCATVTKTLHTRKTNVVNPHVQSVECFLVGKDCGGKQCVSVTFRNKRSVVARHIVTVERDIFHTTIRSLVATTVHHNLVCLTQRFFHIGVRHTLGIVLCQRFSTTRIFQKLRKRTRWVSFINMYVNKNRRIVGCRLGISHKSEGDRHYTTEYIYI